MDSTITAHVTWTFTTISGIDDRSNKMLLKPPKPGPALSVLLRTYDSLIISLENKSHYDANSDSRLCIFIIIIIIIIIIFSI